MHTLTTDQLAELLRASAADLCDTYATETAAQILCGHRRLLDRADYLAACVDYDHDGIRPVAWVVWDAIPGYVERAALSSSEANILRLVAELAGIDTGVSLACLLAGLDEGNSRLVLDAFTPLLSLGGR